MIVPSIGIIICIISAIKAILLTIVLSTSIIINIIGIIIVTLPFLCLV